MISKGIALLLLVANAKALRDSNFGIRSLSNGRARSFECTADGLFCDSCTSSCLCTAVGATPRPIEACGTGQVCGGPAPGQGCSPYVDNDAGTCDCDTIGNSGFLVDPYDPSNYFLCIPPQNQFFLSCAEGQIFSTEDNTCIMEPTPTPSTEVSQVDSSTDKCSEDGIGLHTNDPTCETYTACFSTTLPGLLLLCDVGQVFDSSQLKCVTECDLAPTTFACPPSSMGALPDTSDCTIFHVCSNGVAVTPATGVPCPDGEAFESTSMTCTSSDVVCPETKQCWDIYCEACGGPCPVSPLTLTTITSLTTTPTSPTTTPTSSTTTPTSPTTTPTSPTTPPTAPTTTPTSPTTTPTSPTTTATSPTTTPTSATTTPTSPTTTLTSTTPPTSPTTTPTSPSTTPTTPTTIHTSPTTTPTTTSTSTISPTGPPACNSSSSYHEHPDCKQFYACQSNGAGGFEPVLYRCPGSLVFIPTKNYCSLQSDLPAAPGCIAI